MIAFRSFEEKDVKSYLDDAVATGKKGTKMYEQNAAELKAVNAQLKKEQAAAKKKPKLAKLSAAEKSSINMDLANKYAAGDKLSDKSMASLNSSIKKEIEKLKKDSAKLEVQIKEAKAAPKKAAKTKEPMVWKPTWVPENCWVEAKDEEVQLAVGQAQTAEQNSAAAKAGSVPADRLEVVQRGVGEVVPPW